MNKNQTFALNWKKNSEKLDLCIKLEKITNRTFALNWKKISEKLDLCIKLEKIINRTFALNWKIMKIGKRRRKKEEKQFLEVAKTLAT